MPDDDDSEADIEDQTEPENAVVGNVCCFGLELNSKIFISKSASETVMIGVLKSHEFIIKMLNLLKICLCSFLFYVINLDQ